MSERFTLDDPAGIVFTGAPLREAFDEAKHPRGQPGNAGEFGPGGGQFTGPGESHARALDLWDDLDDRDKAPPIFHEPHRVAVEGRILALLGAAGKKAPSLTFRVKHQTTMIHQGDRTLGTVHAYEDDRGLGVELSDAVAHGKAQRAVIMPDTPPEVAEYRLRRVLRLPVPKALRDAQPPRT